jgi:DnaJ-domain-containing protein 1
MREPIALEPERFFEFVSASDAAVVFVSVHRAHKFNAALCRHFTLENADEPACAEVDLADLIMFAQPILAFLQSAWPMQRANAYARVPAGYWLFRAGRVIAWHSGLPTGLDLRVLADGALLGALWSGVTQNPAFLLRGVIYAAEDATAKQIAEHFHQSLTEQPATDAHGAPRGTRAPPALDELQRAYVRLGVAPTASDVEIERAWRRLRIAVHPDLAAGDPVEFARRSRISAELNHARDIIREHRAHKRHRASA